MNLSDDEDQAPAADPAGKEPGKRKIGEVEPKPRPACGNNRYLTSSFALLDSFGDIKALSLDKFGALRDSADERPRLYRRVQTTAGSSTGSSPPLEHKDGKQYQGTDIAAAATQAVNDSSSTWSKYIDLDWENEGTSNPGSSKPAGIEADPSSRSSVPISCTLHERKSTSSAQATLQQQLCAPPQQDVDKSQYQVPEFSPNEQLAILAPLELHNDSEEPGVYAAGSLPTTALSRSHSIDHCYRSTRAAPAAAAAPTPTVLRRSSTSNIVGSSGTQLLAPGSCSSSISRSSQNINQPGFAYMGSSSEDAAARPGHSRQSTDIQYPERIHYRFASASLEASLLQRMEERQRVQDEAEGEERVCGHVISPEDLIWGSVKHYCGVVLDRETRALLGTAILFIPPDQSTPERAAAGTTSSTSTSSGAGAGAGRQGAAAAAMFPKSAWVTSVKVVEGRTEVLIKNSKGNIHVAQLLLTSTTLGLALFSVHVWQGTFALAFLSRVAGPASLPHRLFVDVDRSNRVYVIGYEEPWDSEAGTIADVRVRPGRIVDAGRHEILEIDFTAGRLGGSINSPAGFRGGLVVRADGHLAGVVTGEVLASHPTNIDFSSAYNVYSLLEEL